jgi:hypothetical protein
MQKVLPISKLLEKFEKNAPKQIMQEAKQI